MYVEGLFFFKGQILILHHIVNKQKKLELIQKHVLNTCFAHELGEAGPQY